MACLDLSTRFVWALLLAHRAVDPPSSLAEGRTPPLAPPRCGARLPDARSMRGDPHTELTSENASNKTRSEQSGLGSRRRLEDKRAAHALRSAREDDNVGLPRAIRASGASNQISDRAPTIGGQTSSTRSSFCERGRQRRTPTRDPRERSEQSNLGSHADDWRTNEQHTLFVLRERTTTSDSHARSARAERAIKY
jgi:hypothetical protein